MIQRKQSLWLLLSAVCAFLSFQFPYFKGEMKNGIQAELDGGSSLFLLLTTGACLLIAVITIFLFKDRKLQLKLTFAGMLLSIILLVLYIVEIGNYVKGTLALTCLFVFGIIAGFILAARGIRKDEKLVKSLDKLR